jgi:hypothetical protein
MDCFLAGLNSGLQVRVFYRFRGRDRAWADIHHFSRSANRYDLLQISRRLIAAKALRHVRNISRNCRALALVQVAAAQILADHKSERIITVVLREVVWF